MTSPWDQWAPMEPQFTSTTDAQTFDTYRQETSRSISHGFAD